MNAGGVNIRLCFVTGGAMNRFGRLQVVRMFGCEVSVAFRAVCFGVDRRQADLLINEKGGFFAVGQVFYEVLIAVALEAFLVWDWLGFRGGLGGRRTRD